MSECDVEKGFTKEGPFSPLMCPKDCVWTSRFFRFQMYKGRKSKDVKPFFLLAEEITHIFQHSKMDEAPNLSWFVRYRVTW